MVVFYQRSSYTRLQLGGPRGKGITSYSKPSLAQLLWKAVAELEICTYKNR